MLPHVLRQLGPCSHARACRENFGLKQLNWAEMHILPSVLVLLTRAVLIPVVQAAPAPLLQVFPVPLLLDRLLDELKLEYPVATPLQESEEWGDSAYRKMQSTRTCG